MSILQMKKMRFFIFSAFCARRIEKKAGTLYI